MAKDTADKKTPDAFQRGRGRPRTSTPEKKLADAAERQRRYRARQSLKNQVMINAASTRDNAFWLDFMRHLNGLETESSFVQVKYNRKGSSAPKFSNGSWQDVENIFLDPGNVKIEIYE